MSAPRRSALIRGMTCQPATLLAGPDGRAAARRLLRWLGLPGTLCRFPAERVAPGIRFAARLDAGPVAAFLLETPDGALSRTVLAAGRALRSGDDFRFHVIILLATSPDRLVLACSAPGSRLRHCELDRLCPRHSDAELLAELAAEPGDTPAAVAHRLYRALDRSRVTGRFFRDVVAVCRLVARSWTGVPRTADGDRDGLALLLLSRLMFLYFLQRQGLLAGDRDFLPGLLRTWRRGRHSSSFYRRRLRTVFFHALNRLPAQRTATARELGPLPYLNGGLFEKHRLEHAHPHHDLSDDVLQRVFDDLLEKYRFTAAGGEGPADGARDAGGIDPEILGRIFEGLMPGDRRARTGTFYTPSDFVDRIAGISLAHHLTGRCGLPLPAAIAAVAGNGTGLNRDEGRRVAAVLRDIRVLDPACGSGAFLMGAMSRIARLRAQLDDPRTPAAELRRDVVARSLHGVDLLEDAALICSLRLWLALVPDRTRSDRVPPLPNLDRRIRQGDALIDPLYLNETVSGRPLESTAPPELRSLLSALQPAGAEYLRAGPDTRPRIRARLHRLERDVASAWLTAALGRLSWDARELAARSGDRDLFGEPTRAAVTARSRLRTARSRLDELDGHRRAVIESRRLPFFSFPVHFAEAHDGFDLILSNPPWVRSLHWPPTAQALLRDRYTVCSRAGWPYAAVISGQPAGAGSQVDLSLLFLERSIGLLRQGGTLGVLLPAKVIRSLYAGGARSLLADSVHVEYIEDHSLDHRAVFDADAFTAVVVARRPQPDHDDGAPDVNVRMKRAGSSALTFSVPRHDLALVPGDDHSPWLLAPPACRAALRQMQQIGECLGSSVTIRRGVMTGANDILVVRDLRPGLGDMARIRTDGYFRALSAHTRKAFSGWIEASALRPALRGADVSRWAAQPSRYVVWVPQNDDPSAVTPPRLHRFLARHRRRLDRGSHGVGTLQRLSPLTLGHKVVWSDVAADLRAAVVPARTRTALGTSLPVVPLNTAYFAATMSERESLVLAAYLNSLPVRIFARAIAERAKDGHFRFFAWTVAVIPLPAGWRSGPVADRLEAIACASQRRGAIDSTDAAELDTLVADGYRLDRTHRASLAAFGEWLDGNPGREA
jgi:hypothetical protein